MARVPYQGVQDVGQQGPAGVMEHAQATPQEFGAGVGQAEQGLARAGEQTSDLIAQNAQRLQELTNDRNANQAINGYMTAAGQEWDKYGSMEGQAAHDYYPKFQQNLANLRDQYGASLQSPMAKQMYDNYSRFMTSRLVIQGGSKASEGLKQSFATTYQQNFDSAVQGGILGQNDPATVALQATRAADSARQTAVQLRGMTPEQADNEAQKGRGAYYQRVLKDMVDKGNVGQAAQMYNTVRPNLDGGSTLAIDNMMRPIVRNQAMDSYIDSKMGSAGGFIGHGTPIQAPDLPSGAAKLLPVIAWGEENNGYASSAPKGDQSGNPIQGNRYQFLRSTYNTQAPGAGVDPNDTSAASQDKVAWSYASRVYRDNTGRDLNADVAQGGHETQIAGALNKVWPSLPGGSQQDQTMQQFSARLGGIAQKSPAEMAFPDEQEIVQGTIRDFPDPYEAQQVIGKIRSRFATLELATKRDRDALSATLPQMEAQALDGHDIQIPEAQIRHLYPPEKAAELIENLGITKAVGPQFQAVKWGTPEQVQQAEARLSSNLGLGGANPETSDLPELEGSSEAYKLRQTLLKKFQTAVNQRNAALDGDKADPAAYVAQSPLMQQSLAQLGAPMPPGLSQDQQQAIATQRAQKFVQDSISFQQGLGVRNPHVLTRADAAAEATKINSADPATADVGQMLASKAKAYGQAWPQVFGDLVSLGKLSPEYQTLAQIESPTARSDFQRMLKTVAANPKGRESLYDSVGKAGMTSISNDLAINDALKQFAQTAQVPGIRANVDQIEQVHQAVKDLAAFYSLPGGGSTSGGGLFSHTPTALERAASAVIGDKYDFDTSDNYLRVPKTQATLKQVQDYGDALKSGLKPEDLQGARSAITPQSLGIEQSQDQGVNERVQRDIISPIQAAGSNVLGSIQRTGKWVTNESDNGAYLVAQDENGRNRPVYKKDGSRVEFSWKDARGGPPAPPATALRGDVPPVVQ
jgi:hypothetical protein